MGGMSKSSSPKLGGLKGSLAEEEDMTSGLLLVSDLRSEEDAEGESGFKS